LAGGIFRSGRDTGSGKPFERPIYNSQPKRIFALHWLRQQERAAELREQEIYSYTRRTYWAAVAAVILAIFGLMAMLMH
jgi:hypothetical protein